MAKYECQLTGDFTRLLRAIESQVVEGNISGSFEAGSDYQIGNVRCAVRVFERYSLLGKNRVSMNVTLIGNEQDLFISAITSGGSQAVFFKLNTFGEESFLECIVNIVERFKQSR